MLTQLLGVIEILGELLMLMLLAIDSVVIAENEGLLEADMDTKLLALVEGAGDELLEL